MQNENVTIDGNLLRSRLNSSFSSYDYIKRPIIRPNPRQVDDVYAQYFKTKTQATNPLELDNSKNHISIEENVQKTAEQTYPKAKIDNQSDSDTNSDFTSSQTLSRLANNNISVAEPKTSHVLARTLVSKPKRFTTKHFKFNYSFALKLAAVLFIIAGGYLGYSGWQANKQSVQQASNLTKLANSIYGGSSSNMTANPKVPNNTQIHKVLSTVKPTAAQLSSFVASPNDPKYLNIPSIGVHTTISPVGLLSNGALGTPYNVYYTDWYNQSALPGQPGAELIDGHVSSWTSKGVFYYIDKLVPGDTIQVVNGAGKDFNYVVVKSQIYPANSVDMNAAVTPINSAYPGLNLITCTGQVIPNTSLFNERIIVFAELTSS